MAKLSIQANELAEKLDVAPAAVSNWTRGINGATPSQLRKLGEELSVDPSWLAGDEEDLAQSDSALREEGQAYRFEDWQQRALDAEKRLSDLRGGLKSLLDLSGSEKERGGRPRGPSSKPPSEDANILDALEGGEPGQTRLSPPSTSTGGPSAPASPPSGGTSPESTNKPVPPKPAPK